MLQLIRIELKRLFSNKLSLLVPIVTSVITLLLLASMIAPVLFTGKKYTSLQIGLVVEDDSQDLNLIVHNVLGSKNFKDFFELNFVDSLDTGHEMLQKGDIAFLVHIPEDTTHKLYYREKVSLHIWLNPDYALESSLFLPIAEQVVMGFNKIQSDVDVIYEEASQKLSYDIASDHLYNVLIQIIASLIDRQSFFNFVGISPFGRFLAFEYYIAAAFSFFAALGIVPVCGFYAKDFSDTTLRRGLSNKIRYHRYLFARLFSGTIYILIVCIPMVILGFILSENNVFMTGNVFFFLLGLVLSAFCYASLALLIALVLPKGDNAVWIAFFFILIAAFLGGVFVPNSLLPPLVDFTGKFLPLRASLNAFASSLFNFNITFLVVPFIVLIAWTIITTTLSIPLFERRMRS